MCGVTFHFKTWNWTEEDENIYFPWKHKSSELFVQYDKQENIFDMSCNFCK